MSTTRSRAALLAGASLAAAAVAAAPASAATVEVDGGRTFLRLDKGTAKALDGLGVSVSAVGAARGSRNGITFPVTGGAIDPVTGAGRYRHAGGLQLRAGKVKVRLLKPTINAGTSNTIGVSVGGERVRALKISLSAAKVTRSGFGTNVSRVRVTLTRAGARALNGAFHVHAFRRGTRIGTASVKATPADLAFDGGATSLALDAGAAAALGSLGVAVAPAAPASANADGSIAFPITEGLVDARSLAGEVAHAGGLTFSKGATAVTVRDFVIDTSPTPTLTADLGGQRVDLLALDLAGLQRSARGREVTLGGVVATLTAGAAQALNDAFGTTAFAAGLRVGTATVVAQGV